MGSYKCVIYGCGPIGLLISKVAIKKGFEVVGAIDVDPNLVGRDVGELIGLEGRLGVKVDSNADKVLMEGKPDVVFHATGSWLDKVYPQIVKAIRAKADVVSTCETLAYPWYRYPELACLIDNFAKAHGATVIGTGVNPGFVFEALPAFLSVSIAKLEKVRVVRSLDAAKRRYPFQKKIGLSMSPEEFKAELAKGAITAHVGYAESVCLLADMLNIKIDRVEERQEASIAEKEYTTQYFHIKPGTVKGVVGYGVGLRGEEEVIRVELRAIVGADEYEEVVFEGEPRIAWRSTGTPGDLATAAIVVNVAPKVIDKCLGLITLKELVKYTYYSP